MRVSAWTEEQLLEFFWAASREKDKLELLRWMADIVVPRPDGWSGEQVREQSLASRRNVKMSGCFACLSADRPIHWHHVIQVQHGGSSALRNMVAICRSCHAVVHPWMPEYSRTEDRYSPWTAIGTIDPAKALDVAIEEARVGVRVGRAEAED